LEWSSINLDKSFKHEKRVYNLFMDTQLNTNSSHVHAHLIAQKGTHISFKQRSLNLFWTKHHHLRRWPTCYTLALFCNKFVI